MSSNTNPQVEMQLDKLATICCEQIKGEQVEQPLDDRTIDMLLKSLLMSGYARQEGRALVVDIEARVKDKCREIVLHRGGELSSITGKLQNKFDKLAQWESRQPTDDTKAKAANISSATDA